MSEVNSIINNSDPELVSDNISPYTYIEFLSKYTGETDVPLEEYQEYIKEWADYKQKLGERQNVSDLIKTEVINLLKILIVKFTSYDEQLFLANLDWGFETGDPALTQKAIKTALPIFIKRLKDIGGFYRQRRETARSAVSDNKIKGTSRSLEKIILNKVLQYLFNNADNDIMVNVEKSLKISIDNLIAISDDYFDTEKKSDPEFNLTPNTNETLLEQGVRDIYFNLEETLSEILFDNNVYLKEIPLIAELAVDLAQDCVGELGTLKESLIVDNELCLISDEEKIELRKKIYKKYLGVDYYYFYVTPEGLVMSDLFVKADNPTNNLLNIQTVDTPKVLDTQLEKLKNIGLFFKPGKTGMLRVNTKDFTYSIDTNKVKYNTMYIFPDPKIYSNVGFSRIADYPLIIEYSFDEYIKSTCYGIAEGDPYVGIDQQPCFAYYSKEQDIGKIDRNALVLKDFSQIYNEGIIKKYKIDLYGNKYALFEYGGDTDTVNERDINIVVNDSITVTGDDNIIKFDNLVQNYSTTIVNTRPGKRGDKSKTQLYICTAANSGPIPFIDKFPWLKEDEFADILEDVRFIDIINDTIILRNGSGKLLIDVIEYDYETDEFSRKIPYRAPFVLQTGANTYGDIYSIPENNAFYMVDIFKTGETSAKYVLYEFNYSTLTYNSYDLVNEKLNGPTDDEENLWLYGIGLDPDVILSYIYRHEWPLFRKLGKDAITKRDIKLGYRSDTNEFILAFAINGEKFYMAKFGFNRVVAMPVDNANIPLKTTIECDGKEILLDNNSYSQTVSFWNIPTITGNFARLDNGTIENPVKLKNISLDNCHSIQFDLSNIYLKSCILYKIVLIMGPSTARSYYTQEAKSFNVEKLEIKLTYLKSGEYKELSKSFIYDDIHDDKIIIDIPVDEYGYNCKKATLILTDLAGQKYYGESAVEWVGKGDNEIKLEKMLFADENTYGILSENDNNIRIVKF